MSGAIWRPTRRRVVRWCVGIFLCAACAGTASGLDFLLHTIRVQEDGFNRELSWFNGAGSRVLICLPHGWNCEDAATFLSLTSPASTGSLIRLEISAFTPAMKFDAKGLETYRKLVLASLPEGAVGARITEEHVDPLPIFHWKDYEFVVDYEYFGDTYRRSLVFVDLDAKQQVAVTSLARKPAYDHVHNLGLDLMRSWQVAPQD